MPTLAYRLFNAWLRPVFRLALDLRLEGLEKLPRTGAAILAVNHTSYVDPLLLGAFAKRPIAMMSKAENFHLPFFGLLVRLYGAFPVHRGAADRAALQTALNLLNDGQLLLMAPEGTRSKDGALQKGHDGVALLAARSGAPVVPVAIGGAHQVARNVRRLRRTRVTVQVGDPLRFELAAGRAGRGEMTHFTAQLMIALAAMLPPEQRGLYGAPGRVEEILSSSSAG